MHAARQRLQEGISDVGWSNQMSNQGLGGRLRVALPNDSRHRILCLGLQCRGDRHGQEQHWAATVARSDGSAADPILIVDGA